MKLRYKKQFTAEVATSSLNDIMFFLLLFFLIISTVTNPNVIKIVLPQSKASQAINKMQVTLTVTPEKEYFINKQPVPYAKLETAIVEACKNMEEPTIVIRLPYSLSVQDLVDVMQIGVKHKIKMVLATKNS